ncbi:hypothetical protein [Flavobacterium sp.]|uniref:hypothetical protein n=1 Tax=Flavobacterium sp. TaxID=239 RepID=UPI0025BEBA97|nr:hypothetical protein [Flavobacterium sp.]
MNYIKNNCLFLLLSCFQIFSQKIETSLGGGIDLTNKNNIEIYELWKNYLSSNPDTLYDNPYWNASEKKKFKSYDLLKSEGFLNPSLYALEPKNIVLYIKESGEDFLIRSMYYWINEDGSFNPLAITNVFAKKEKDSFKLYNYMPYYTLGWKTKTIGVIKYFYHEGYVLDEGNAVKANNFLEKLIKTFDLDIGSVTYYIANDCDEVQRMKGYDYIISMGRSPNFCAFYDDSNNIIYSTVKAGEFHSHELIHAINSKYPNASSMLLSGLSIYTTDEKSHLGKPFLVGLAKVQAYLEKNPNIDLLNFEKLPQTEGTDLYYYVGALIADAVLKKGGINLLKDALNCGKEDADLVEFLHLKLKMNNSQLNILLKEKIKVVNKTKKMVFLLDLSNIEND